MENQFTIQKGVMDLMAPHAEIFNKINDLYETAPFKPASPKRLNMFITDARGAPITELSSKTRVLHMIFEATDWIIKDNCLYIENRKESKLDIELVLERFYKTIKRNIFKTE